MECKGSRQEDGEPPRRLGSGRPGYQEEAEGKNEARTQTDTVRMKRLRYKCTVSGGLASIRPSPTPELDDSLGLTVLSLLVLLVGQGCCIYMEWQGSSMCLLSSAAAASGLLTW